jgi:hypothetical protein
VSQDEFVIKSRIWKAQKRFVTHLRFRSLFSDIGSGPDGKNGTASDSPCWSWFDMFSISLTTLLGNETWRFGDGSLSLNSESRQIVPNTVHPCRCSTSLQVLRFPECFMQVGPLFARTVRDPDGPLGKISSRTASDCNCNRATVPRPFLDAHSRGQVCTDQRFPTSRNLNLQRCRRVSHSLLFIPHQQRPGEKGKRAPLVSCPDAPAIGLSQSLPRRPR